MHIKRFEAPTMAAALEQVRRELGPEALVLQSRQVRREGMFGMFAKPVVEVTAAVDREHRDSPSDTTESASPGRRGWREIQVARALIEPIEDQVRGVRRTVDALTGGGEGPLTIAAEINELRRLVAELRLPPIDGMRSQAAALVASGLEPRHAYALAAEASAEEGRDLASARVACQRVLIARLETRMRIPRADDAPTTLLVGPTGAGKTTSLAKVAGRERAAGRELAVVTTDAHRYGAELLLRRFSRDLEVPFEVAVSPEVLAERVKRFRRRTLFVDTAGRSPADSTGLPELRALRDALGEHTQVQLVVSATTKQRDLRAQIDRFRLLQPDGLIVTKTDESEDLVNIVNVLLDEDTPPLCWLGSGQRVPQDLQVPDPRELATAVLGAAA